MADATRPHGSNAPEGVSDGLAIGVTSLVAGYYLSELLSRYRRNCPGVEVFVTEETPPFLEHLLINESKLADLTAMRTALAKLMRRCDSPDSKTGCPIIHALAAD